MAQTVRFATLEKFKAGELQLLVCSDVAARGLDIGGLSHVFNFDVPHHAEDYVHRIGRTGRAGLEGQAFTIAAPDDRFAVEAIEKLTGHPHPADRRRGPRSGGLGRGRRSPPRPRARPSAAAKPAPKRARAPKAERPHRSAAASPQGRNRRAVAPAPPPAAPGAHLRDRAPRRRRRPPPDRSRDARRRRTPTGPVDRLRRRISLPSCCWQSRASPPARRKPIRREPQESET